LFIFRHREKRKYKQYRALGWSLFQDRAGEIGLDFIAHYAIMWVLLWRTTMTDKTWEEQEKEDQNHYDLVLEVAKLREQNKQMKETLRTIWETDALQLWAFENPDDEVSIADLVRECLGNK